MIKLNRCHLLILFYSLRFSLNGQIVGTTDSTEWVSMEMNGVTKNEIFLFNSYYSPAPGEISGAHFDLLLEQHHKFDWLTRCFIVCLNPSKAYRKIREYATTARKTTPAVVIWWGEFNHHHATVLCCTGEGGFSRVDCESPEQAISAWLHLTKRYASGALNRKTNVDDIIDRVQTVSESGASASTAPVTDCLSIDVSED